MRCAWASQIGQGLAAASNAGVPHPDLKPQNVLIVGPDERIKMTDFGVARLRRAAMGSTPTPLGAVMQEYTAPQPVRELRPAERNAGVCGEPSRAGGRCHKRKTEQALPAHGAGGELRPERYPPAGGTARQRRQARANRGSLWSATSPPVSNFEPETDSPSQHSAQLKVDLLVWAADPRERMVYLNGHKYVEGERLENGAVIEQIAPDGVVLVHGGRRVRLPSDARRATSARRTCPRSRR